MIATHDTLSVTVDGGALTVTATGTGAPALLVHGTAPAIWGELPALLAPGHRLISYDRRSFGAARDLAADGLSVHAADAAAIVRACGSPSVVIGWSIGGVIALELAAAHPELVSGLVLLEPPLHAKRHPRPRMIAAIAGATALGKFGRPESGARRFLRWALGRRDGSSDLDRMPPEWHERLVAGDGTAVVRELAAGTGEHIDAETLARIAAPVRVLRGDRSQPVFADAAQRIAAGVGRAVLVDIAGSGHAIQLDAPQRVAENVAATSERAS